MSETGVTGQPDIQAVTFTPAHYSAAPLGPLQPSSMTSGPRTAPSGPGSWSSLLWLLAWEDMGTSGAASLTHLVWSPWNITSHLKFGKLVSPPPWH